MKLRSFIAGAALVTAGCGGGTGQIKISLTDAPTDLAHVSQVNINVDEIRVHSEAVSTKPEAGPDADKDGTDGAGWVVLCKVPQTFDLMQLTNGRFAPMCPTTLPDGGVGSQELKVAAGRISQLRLHLTSAEVVFNDGTPTAPLTVPSGSTSGLKIDIHRDVPAGGVLDLKLDFDAASSINKEGNGGLKLSPVLKLLP